jgi:hypothetical protein
LYKITINKLIVTGGIFTNFSLHPSKREAPTKVELRIHNMTAKAALKFGSEVWVLKKRDEQHLEAAQM